MTRKPRALGGRAIVTVAVALAAPACLPASGSATLPGSNGLIALGHPVCFDFDCEDFGARVVGVHPRTGERTRLVPCRGRECQDGAPAWGPRGRLLVVSRIPEGGDWRERLLLLARPGASVPPRSLARGVQSAAWSPDGRRLVITRFRARTPRLFVMSRSGERERRLTFRNGDAADWSARNRIAFARRRDDRLPARQDIFSIRPNGRGLRRLTRDGCSTDPSWSPDGRRLVFTRYCRGEFGTYVMNAYGTGVRVVIPGAHEAVWSPDGERIAFNRGDRLYTANAQGGDIRVVWRRPGSFLSLAWQPRR
jgi:dipeptidyl aminopeptidase/acylaminoacyl peptidase